MMHDLNNFGWITDLNEAYCVAAIERELMTIARNIEEGDRNNQLFKSSCAVFSLVKAGLGTKEGAEELLIEAATLSGYAAEEPQQMMATLTSAWKTATPRNLSAIGTAQQGIVRNGTNLPTSALLSCGFAGVKTTFVIGKNTTDDQAELIIEAFEQQNADQPRLFKRNTVLCRLRSSELSLSFEVLNKDALTYEINRVACFTDKRGSFVSVPPALISHIAGMPDYNLPELRGIRHVPFFDANGRLVQEAGYDPSTGYYLNLPAELKIPKVPNQPTPYHTQQALRCILECTFDFPFADRSSKRAYIALLLLLFCRDMVKGATPIHLFSKPTPGTGAGLAVDVFSMIATGRKAAVQAEAASKEEFRKNITSFLMSGEPYYFLDNLHQDLNDPAFAAALTAEVWRDRLLGKSQMVEMPIRNAWIVAGNNPQVSEELSRRTVLIGLDARTADPGARTKFRHRNLIEYVSQRRGPLIAACLTLVQAWVVGVMKKPKQPGSATLASFEGWACTMSGILESAGVKGLLVNRTRLQANTIDQSASLKDFVSLWFSRYRDQDMRVGTFQKSSAGGAYGMIPDRETLVELLHSNRGQIDLGFNNRQESQWQRQMGIILTNGQERVFEVTQDTCLAEVQLVKVRHNGGNLYRLNILRVSPV